MKYSLTHTTRVAVSLAINVMVDDDRYGSRLIEFPLFYLTRLALCFWSSYCAVRRAKTQGQQFLVDAAAATLFTWTVLIIGVKSMAFGAGVRL
ncbi:MAG: hypothetical protein D6768_01515 [Chloroflexi bacterium]|nr:MAG: hypothetical protein D6768_01515 [Chloroflexota bacterium]